MSTVVQEKDPDTPITYEVLVFEAFVQDALRGLRFDVNDVVRAEVETGFYYECTTSGRTKARYPTWPRTAEQTVQDGTVIWTARHPDGVSVPEISSVVWTVPADLSLDSQQESGHIASITLSGGTAGEDYEVTARITATSGAVVDKTFTIPVRQQ